MPDGKVLDNVTFNDAQAALRQYHAQTTARSLPELRLPPFSVSRQPFAPQTPEAKADAARGIREFVAGTGGKNHRRFELLAHANSEVRNADTFGVLKLTLKPGKYAWEFVPVDGGTFRDSGEGSCH